MKRPAAAEGCGPPLYSMQIVLRQAIIMRAAEASVSRLPKATKILPISEVLFQVSPLSAVATGASAAGFALTIPGAGAGGGATAAVEGVDVMTGASASASVTERSTSFNWSDADISTPFMTETSVSSSAAMFRSWSLARAWARALATDGGIVVRVSSAGAVVRAAGLVAEFAAIR